MPGAGHLGRHIRPARRRAARTSKNEAAGGRAAMTALFPPPADTSNRDYSADIARVPATPGGHLTVGRGGFSLHYLNGSPSGYDVEAVKAQAIAAGLPVIDRRCVEFGRVVQLAICGPMIAAGRKPGPEPSHASSY